MKIKITLLIMMFALLGLSNKANAGNDPKWKASFAKEIKWVKVSEIGVPILATEDGLFGMNSEDGSILWKNEELKNLIVETYEPLTGTPFIIINPTAPPVDPKKGLSAMSVGVPKGYIVIINSLDGTVVCDTRKLGMTNLMAQHNISELNAVIFVGMKGVKLKEKRSCTIFYDFNTNSVIWDKEMYLDAFVPPALIDNDNLIVTSTLGYSIVSTKTGDVKYKKEIKFKDVVEAPKMVFNKDRTVVYYVNKKFGNAYNLSDGSPLWKTPIDMDDPATHVFVDASGIYIAVPKTINLFDYNTGEPKWGKDGIKLFDPMVSYVFTEKGLGIQMGSDGDYSVNLLNYETGKPLVKKAVKLKAAAVDLRMVSKGLLYRSSVELNILDGETGKPSFDKSIKFKEAVIAIDKGDHTYIFSGTQFYDFNNSTCEYVNKIIPNSFEGKEIPKDIEIRNGGILLKSDQNLSMFDYEGKLIYHVYNKAPGISMAAKIALAAVAAASTAVAMGSAAASGATKSSNQSLSDMHQRNADNFGGAASAGFKAMGKRFNASKEADGFVTMLTGLDSGVGVVKVNKDNGKTENEVIFKEKEPIYEIDDLGGMLYFKSSKLELSGFKF